MKISEIQDSINKQLHTDYIINEEDPIGRGACGKVYNVYANSAAYDMIVKVVDINKIDKDLDKEEDITPSRKPHVIKSIIEYSNNELIYLDSLKDTGYFTRIINYCRIDPLDEPYPIFVSIQKKYECLSDYYSNHDITGDTVVQIGIDICDALAKLEELNILHRDVKPSNIFVEINNSGYPHFILGDFGIARVLEDNYGIVTGIGTEGFKAPELNDRIHVIDKSKADIYGLGATLLAILTGGIEDDDPCGNINLIPEKFKPVILKATEQNPQNRFETATQFKKAIEDIRGLLDYNITKNKYYLNSKRYLIKSIQKDKDGSLVFNQDILEAAKKEADDGIKEYKMNNFLFEDEFSKKSLYECQRIFAYIKTLEKTVDETDIDTIYEMACDNDAFAQYLLSHFLLENEFYDDFIEWLGKSAENKSVIGMYVYGRALYSGEYCKKDERGGLKNLEEAALKDFIPAIRFLQRIKKDGRYSPSNPVVGNKINITILNYRENRFKYYIPYI